MSGDATVVVENLTVGLEGGANIVEDVSLRIRPGEVLGLVGESGSGKTTVALALLGYANEGVRIRGGSVRVAGEELVGRTDDELRRIRGRIVSYVPQDPATSLNPSIRIGEQIREVLRFHAPQRATDAEVAHALASVQLPGDRSFQRRYPHQLSGGQQQRVAIAIAIVCHPVATVLDEPTTGLDVVTQARILEEIGRIRDERGVALVYVSHDLAVISTVADRIAVMYAGRIVEQGTAAAIINTPHHPYTRGLVASVPDHIVPRVLRGIPGVAVGVGDRPVGCAFAPRCDQAIAACEVTMPELETLAGDRAVRCFAWRATPGVSFEDRRFPPAAEPLAQPLLAVEALHAQHRIRDGVVVAAAEVSFAVGRGACVALVGESGSGKTTIARCVAGLHARSGGRVALEGVELAPLAHSRTREQRRRLQIVFQNPYESLNPRHTVQSTLAWPAQRLAGLSRAEATAQAVELLERVRLPKRAARRYPSELSGGERQRVAIARALAVRPDLIVCDEVTSALDVSVQAAVLDLLAELRRELGLALLFITHDLGVVASIADQVLVLDRGVVCEAGSVAELLGAPRQEYTKTLVAAAPSVTGSGVASAGSSTPTEGAT